MPVVKSLKVLLIYSYLNIDNILFKCCSHVCKINIVYLGYHNILNLQLNVFCLFLASILVDQI